MMAAGQLSESDFYPVDQVANDWVQLDLLPA